MTTPAPCPACGKPIVVVHGVPNPRTAAHLFLARPCNDPVGLHEVIGLVPVITAPITGAALAAAERERQVTEEGYTLDYDDQHTAGQLPWAAYGLLDKAERPDATEQAHPMWPFDRAKWPLDKSPLRLLIIAAALIIAEIDRRLRKGERP